MICPRNRTLVLSEMSTHDVFSGQITLQAGVHVAIGFFSQIFTNFRRRLLIVADVCKNMHFFELIFRARWALFHMLTESIENSIRAPFSRPGSVCFSDSLRFSHQFWPNFCGCLSILCRFRLVFCFPGRFPAETSKNMQVCCFAKHSHHTPI